MRDLYLRDLSCEPIGDCTGPTHREVKLPKKGEHADGAK
jgi:hypothetical protein